MGSPLSPSLAGIFIDHLENLIFNSTTPITKKAISLYRCVDDVLCIIKEIT